VEKHETPPPTFLGVDLGFAEKVVWEGYHQNGSGRPPRNPLGILKALLVKRLRQIPSDRELYRRLQCSGELRRLCGVKDWERPYHPSQLSRFRRRVGPRRLGRIVDRMVKRLIRGGVIRGEKVALDASFIRAWSRRDPHDNSTGLSDRDARVGRDGKTYSLGYKVHLSVDLDADLPLAVVVASGNRNEKRFAPRLLRKTRSLTKGRARLLVADAQYSSRRFREDTSRRGGEAVIPYPSNQRRGEKGVLRVDSKFRTHGPERERKLYRGRTSVERVFSRLKYHLDMERHRLRGVVNVTVHVLLCVATMLLGALSALHRNRPEEARSLTKLR